MNSPLIWNGNYAKLLKDQLLLGNSAAVIAGLPTGDLELIPQAGQSVIFPLLSDTYIRHSIDVNNRWLISSDTTISIQWADRLLVDIGGKVSIDYGRRYLYASNNSNQLDWSTAGVFDFYSGDGHTATMNLGTIASVIGAYDGNLELNCGTFKELQTLVFPAKVDAVAGDYVRFSDSTNVNWAVALQTVADVEASKVFQDITYTAAYPGAIGDSIAIVYSNTETGDVAVITSIVGTVISIGIDATATRAFTINSELNAYEALNPGAISSLISYSVTGVPTNVQVAQSSYLENGSDATPDPTGAVWLAVDAGHRIKADISGCTDPNSVRAVCESALNGLMNFTDEIVLSHAVTAGVLFVTQQHYGPVAMPVAWNADDTGPSSIGWSQASPGFNGGVKIGSDGQTPMHSLNTATCTAAAGVGTITNLPAGCSGNPAGYVQMLVNGDVGYFPYWKTSPA